MSLAFGRKSVTLTILLGLLCASARSADDPAVLPADSETFAVVVDDDTGTTTITLVACEGRVQCPDIARALARAGGLDDSALDLLPPGHIDLKEARSRLALTALNFALPPEVRVKVRSAKDGAEPSLIVTIDEAGLQKRSRDIRRKLRERAGEDAGKYGLTLDEGWDALPADRPVVVLVHGFNSNPESLAALHTVLTDRGFPCGVYAYPNDGPIEDTAVLLADELRQLRESFPERDVAIVAHSMGGLVARAVIENPELDPGNVRRLILVATPNHGSQLACFSGGTDCADVFARHREGGFEALIRSTVVDGLNEACEDMRPDSAFLRTLNTAERNPHVRYSLFIGTGGPLSDDGLVEVRRAVKLAIERDRLARLLGPKIEGPLADLEEVVREKGDGAVAVKRARLDGVDDTVLLPFSHLTITQRATEPEAQALRDAILERLE